MTPRKRKRADSTTSHDTHGQNHNSQSQESREESQAAATWAEARGALASTVARTLRGWRLEAGLSQEQAVAYVQQVLPLTPGHNSLSTGSISRYEQADTLAAAHVQLETAATLAMVYGHPVVDLATHIDRAIRPWATPLLVGAGRAGGVGGVGGVGEAMTQEESLLSDFRTLPADRKAEIVAFVGMLARASAGGLETALGETDAWSIQHTPTVAGTNPSPAASSHHHRQPGRRRISGG